jgi:hypothetical protein
VKQTFLDELNDDLVCIYCEESGLSQEDIDEIKADFYLDEV